MKASTSAAASTSASLIRTARAALVPVAACAVALGGLTAWTASGAAGRPAGVTVEDARVLVPFGIESTAAMVRLRNTGDEDDELVGVDVPSAGGAMLSRTVVKNGAGTMRMVASVPVPARGTLEMSPHGLDIMVYRPPAVRVGERLPLVLRFRKSGTVRAEATVVRAGS
ncbi:copper chaperone PCu(A)C [Streptomyces cinnamoneus]|uniref:Membrane protein n=1 Tax=Streptomyces cinnamoneus TaxID=53446 RepID=A0A918TCE8_STRCJ|nr:copper chaperone PCu(A)C [Streptomyces cinnamoneus]GHC43143.1 membrane protein [Streptomyces cinnamoneus]